MKTFRSIVFALVVSFLFLPMVAQQPATQPTPVAITIAPESFDPFVGQYEDAVNLGGTVFSFLREGEKFYLRVTNQDKIEILPLSPNKFFITPGNRGDIEFVRDAGGKVTGAIFDQGTSYTLKRIANTPAPDTHIEYKRTEAMIPMRDGVKLFTVILTPETQNENLPIYMERTPYGVAGSSSNRINSSKPELVRDGYIFVFQDIRGREDSEGVFEMLRPPRDKRDPKATDESTDTYDTIEYLLKNTKNNGRVGICGVSYPGWLAAVALVDPHPALKASSPQAPVTDLWMGDDFMHHGAFRQTYAHQWAVPLESAKKGGDIEFNEADLFNWYLKKSLPELVDEMGKISHSWRAFKEHPTWDAYWQAKATNLYVTDTSVPTLVVGGWWDQEDMYGPLNLYKALEKTDKDNQVNLVMGPWNHGGWGGRGRKLQNVDFGSDTGRWFRSEILAPFFAYHLKGKGILKLPEASIFRSGANKWMSYDQWPANGGSFQKSAFYLNADGKVTLQKPTANGDAADSYVSDPANPVPYRKRPILETYGPGSTWYTWLVDDQSFLSDRKDVLKWSSDVLTDDLTITGDVVADLFASTTGSDSDWVVKLIDVYPADDADPKMANYQLMVAEEIFRGRYYKSFEKPEAIKPNAVTEYSINMRGNDHTFKKGHRIMVQVQSTWFPLYNRNPQKYVPNIFTAPASEYQSATQKIFRSAKYPSHINVVVAP
ncbi:MAG: CocE/NonD family hydrolase [Pyrinomonadaceae bacterium]